MSVKIIVEDLKARYIYAVATKVEHRGKGLVKKMLQKSEELSKEEDKKEHLLKSFNEKETLDWLNLLDEEDDPGTWEDNKNILEKAGLSNVKLLWKKDFLAIWSAEKI